MSKRATISALLVLSLCATPALAQWAVIDPTNLVQNINQVRQTVEQVKQLQAQLKNAEKQLESISGSRGMRQLVTDQARDYIPRDWRETLTELEGGGRAGDGGINGALKELRESIGQIGSAGLANVPDGVAASAEASARYDMEAWGRATKVYNRANERFGELEKLGDALNSANDQKAVLDLIARLQLESNMLLNEMVRVQAEVAATDRERLLREEQRAENIHRRAMTGW